MEDQNKNQVNTQPATQPVVPATGGQAATQTPQASTPALAPEVTGKKSFKDMWGNLMTKYKSSSKNVKLLVIVGIVFVFSLFLLLVTALAKGGKGGTVNVAPVATTVPVSGSPLPQVEISNPSRYATDSAVLKIESDVDNLSKEMDAVDLRQSNLRVPTLDFNIKFQ